MIDCAQFLVCFGGAQRAGIAVLSPSGGTIAVTADRIAGAASNSQTLRPKREARSLASCRRRDCSTRSMSEATARALASRQPKTHKLCSSRIRTVGVVLIAVATTPQLQEKVPALGRSRARVRQTHCHSVHARKVRR
jgi:hypothetical protein